MKGTGLSVGSTHLGRTMVRHNTKQYFKMRNSEMYRLYMDLNTHDVSANHYPKKKRRENRHKGKST